MMSVPHKKPEGGPTATLILDGQEYTLPVIAGTTGDRVIDISNLRQLTGGVTTFDPASVSYTHLTLPTTPYV